jgi:uncharacterized metal-binding protein YceD (DUF177 family)
MTKPVSLPQTCWSIPLRVDNVPEDGLHLTVTADPDTRNCVAKLAGVDAVLRLDANFEVARHGSAGLTVTGTVGARVRQTCVLTLEPVESDISEPVRLTFAPPGAAVAITEMVEAVLAADDDDPPEPLVDGRVDLGPLATEFLVLAVDKYPRKPGAEFQPTVVGKAVGSPFDALAVLKKDGNQAT